MEFIKNIMSQNTILSRVVKNIFFILALIVSVSLTIFLASFVFFALVCLLLIGLIIFSYFWLRSKLSESYFPLFRFNKSSQRKTNVKTEKTKKTEDLNASVGPIIDAHNTPDGWSVED